MRTPLTPLIWLRHCREAEYCDELVCLSVSVCLSAIISLKLHVRSPPFFVHVAYGRGEIRSGGVVISLSLLVIHQ